MSALELPEVTEPPRLSLARLDTPLERLERTSAQLGRDLWVKRDDLTGWALSGNKIRKLEYLLAEAQARGAERVVTCGGVNSNHARATAVAAARLGLECRLLLRGEDRVPPAGNLVLSRMMGTEIHFTDAEGYARRDALLAELAGPRGYAVPEGGSNALGALGYIRAARELVNDAEARGLKLSRVVHAASSGGTTAGLALGFAALNRPVELSSVIVDDGGAARFEARVDAIFRECVEAGYVGAELAARARFTAVEGFVGQGYARFTEDELSEYRALAAREGCFVDPVYTGKAYLALARGAFSPDEGATVFLHTGGGFELFAL